MNENVLQGSSNIAQKRFRILDLTPSTNPFSNNILAMYINMPGVSRKRTLSCENYYMNQKEEMEGNIPGHHSIKSGSYSVMRLGKSVILI